MSWFVRSELRIVSCNSTFVPGSTQKLSVSMSSFAGSQLIVWTSSAGSAQPGGPTARTSVAQVWVYAGRRVRSCDPNSTRKYRSLGAFGIWASCSGVSWAAGVGVRWASAAHPAPDRARASTARRGRRRGMNTPAGKTGATGATRAARTSATIAPTRPADRPNPAGRGPVPACELRIPPTRAQPPSPQEKDDPTDEAPPVHPRPDPRPRGDPARTRQARRLPPLAGSEGDPRRGHRGPEVRLPDGPAGDDAHLLRDRRYGVGGRQRAGPGREGGPADRRPVGRAVARHPQGVPGERR